MQRPYMVENKGCRIAAEKPVREAGFAGFDNQALVPGKPRRRVVFGNTPWQPFQDRRVKNATVLIGRGQRRGQRFERLWIIKRGAITRQRRWLERPMAGAGAEMVMCDDDMNPGRAHWMRAGPEDHMQTRRKGPLVL